MTDEAAVGFWQRGIEDLRAETDPPIEVALTETLARVRIGAPLVGRVRVSLEGNWLDTRLEFSSGELGVELGAISLALARKRRWVRLSDGSLSRISASIAALSDESDLVMKGKSRALLPAHQLGRIDRWLEENDGRVDAHVEALRKKLRALAVSAEPVMPEGLRATLRGYQRRGLAWLQFLGALGAGGILADDMGLGKTITTLAFLLQQKEALGPAPSLVVCPTSVAGNWLREAARFTPGLDVVLLHGAAREHSRIAGADIVVTTYALLRKDIAKLEPHAFRVVVLDEAQNIKNADAATTRAAGKLTSSMRLALSGTPMENRLAELWSLASFANPGILGTLRSFETRFERPIVADRESPIAAELRALVRPFLLRRTKDEVLTELPPKTEIDRFVTLRPKDKRMYDALAHALRASVAKDLEKRGVQSSLSVFTAMTRLRQMACDPRLVEPGSPPSSSAKREAFLELVRELALEGRRALVFSQFVQLLTLWRADLDAEKIPYEYLDGSTVKRDDVVQRFQEGDAPLFLISLKAGGAGLNLTAADTVIHCDPWWNPAVEDQATDRAHRIGQDKPVTVVRLVARGTIEEKILSLKAKKRELTRAVIDDDGGALAGLTAEDLARLLGDADEDDVAEARSGAGGDARQVRESLGSW
jgi:SNF2 family DNA or RNA helicase